VIVTMLVGTSVQTGRNGSDKGAQMNKDQFKGGVEEIKGKVKESAGRATGNPDLENRGTAEKIAGKVQKGFGDAKETVKDELDDMKDRS
jgi:uncharacterized protein YjbJ (UPF0337 family)